MTQLPSLLVSMDSNLQDIKSYKNYSYGKTNTPIVSYKPHNY